MKKNVKNRSSSHTSLPVAIAKPYFFDILLKKGRKKAVATLTEVAPDDQSRNEKQKWSRPFDQKNGIMAFQDGINTYKSSIATTNPMSTHELANAVYITRE